MDAVKEPTHYKTEGIECIELMKYMSTPEEFEGFLKLNAFKYLFRYKNKGGLQDLEKSKQYIEGLVNYTKNPDVVNVFKPTEFEIDPRGSEEPECICEEEMYKPFTPLLDKYLDIFDNPIDNDDIEWTEEDTLFGAEMISRENGHLVDEDSEDRVLIIYSAGLIDGLRHFERCDYEEYTDSFIIIGEISLEKALKEWPNADITVTPEREGEFGAII